MNEIRFTPNSPAQPPKFSAWRIAPIHWLARALGVLAHIEGRPYGSARLVKKEPGSSGSTSPTGS